MMGAFSSRFPGAPMPLCQSPAGVFFSVSTLYMPRQRPLPTINTPHPNTDWFGSGLWSCGLLELIAQRNGRMPQL